MTAWNGIAIACDDGRQEGSVRRKVGQSVNIVRQIEDSDLVLDISMLTSNMSVGSSKGGLHCMLENQGRVRLSSPFLPILGCDRTLERVFEVRMLVT